MGPFGFRDIYVQLLLWLLNAKPAGNDTLEILDYHFTLQDPRDNLATNIGRNLNLHIGYFEALQLIGGFSAPDLITAISPNFEKYMDGRNFYGGYGMRTASQMCAVAKRLREDPNTRQAVVTVWDPAWDAYYRGQHDYPCTLSLVFNIRHRKLHLSVTMRSNDVWLGLPYDVLQFTCLQQTMAAFLGLELGTYHHHAVSMHMYLRDTEAAQKIINNFDKETADAEATPPLPAYLASAVGASSWQYVQQDARWIADHPRDNPLQFAETDRPFRAAVANAWSKK